MGIPSTAKRVEFQGMHIFAARRFCDGLFVSILPYARRTTRVVEIVGLLGHSTGGRPGERLMQRLGMPVGDDTILRQLKRDAAVAHCTP